MVITNEILGLVRRQAIFVVNHSGGKDSQAMLVMLRGFVPEAQLVILHADLGDVEWPGTKEHAVRYSQNIPFCVVSAIYKDGSAKGLIDLMIKNADTPNKANRFCTSELKTQPIEKWIRASGHKLIVNCLGIRAGESCDREKGLDKKHFDTTGEAISFQYDPDLSKAGREVYTWLPIFNLSTEAVFKVIAEAGEEPHWAYRAGSTRLSCSFCVLASAADLTRAAGLRKDMYARYVALEKFLGRPVHVSKKPLEELTGVLADTAMLQQAFLEHVETRASIVDRGLQRVRRIKEAV